MDSISLRVHTPKNLANEYLANGELVEALIFNSRANTSLLRNEIDFTAYTVPIMAGEMAMMPIDYMVKQFHWVQNDKKTDFIQGRFHLPSSHYDIGYRVDIDRQFVDISFSIPKYIYGHSVAQFVRNPHNENILYEGLIEEFKHVTRHWYDMLFEVIRDFFRNTFTGIEVSFKHVEIIRLDLAFNQYFKSRDEAVRVAELMAKKHAKTLRGSRGRDEYRHDDHSSGFTSIGRNAYYKVYHKGTEFRTVGDRKRLIKHNLDVIKEIGGLKMDLKKKDFDAIRPGFRKTYDVQGIQDEADLILRHEIRFYPKSFSYYWKRNVFRKNDPAWKEKKRRFTELSTKYVRYTRNRRDEDRFTKEERKEYRNLEMQITRRHRFFMNVQDHVKAWAKEPQYDNVHNDVNEHKQVHFSKGLFNFLLRKFEAIIKDIQIDEMPKWDTIKVRAQEHNRGVIEWNASLYMTKIKKEKTISMHTVKKAYNMIEKYGSLKTAFDEGEYSRSAFYRALSMMEKIGYTSSMSLDPIYIDISFATYFERMRGVGCLKPTYNILFSCTRPNNRRRY